MTLEKRIERLERANRRLRLATVAGFTILAGIFLVGAVAPQQEVRSVVQAHAFEVVDAEGNVRAELRMAEPGDSHGEGALLRLWGYGSSAAVIANGALKIYDGTGANRLRLAMVDGLRMVGPYSPCSEPDLDSRPDSCQQVQAVFDPEGIRYFDDNGTTRVRLDSGRDRWQVTGLLLVDDRGSLIWRAR